MREAWRPLLFCDTELEEDVRTHLRGHGRTLRQRSAQGKPRHPGRPHPDRDSRGRDKQPVPDQDPGPRRGRRHVRGHGLTRHSSALSTSSARSAACHNPHPDCRQKGEIRIQENHLQNNAVGPNRASNFRLARIRQCAVPERIENNRLNPQQPRSAPHRSLTRATISPP